ncbi:ABC transporter ATP-binding protein [Halosimplex pelagicum]|uniref:ABC transporter ATP-binding protein n=1 Tax=Halosimplex pelagicum TaxID=869886 RepID=A0A7D5T9M1_9EURY|nr:ABC transporter ATP-binding protein [Halosimplex pelagicum]QLH82050.1 ABC transporter ATP-binding protein [Halosimplex pelagicum]
MTVRDQDLATVNDDSQTEEDSDDDIVFTLRNSSVSFDMDRGSSKVLDDVDMDIHRGEILGVVGESGSGKSMFASALLDAVVEPGNLTGDITYHRENGDSVDILGLSDEELRQLRWEEVSMVFQGALSSFNPTLDVRTHFEETIDAHGTDMDEGMSHARELLSDLYLNPDRVLDSYPHELSGGMKQRALLALSLVLEPNVLVMDEPTAALDLLMQRSILSLLQNLQEKYSLTIVFITHDLPLVAGLCDRLGVMYAFDMVEVGPTDEMLSNPTHPYTRALLKAVPNLNAPLSKMRPIEGSAPDPVDVPTGCSYHPRCPLADEECTRTEPGYSDVTDDHETACFHWEDAAEEIPLEFDIDDSFETTTYEGQQSDDALVEANDLSVHFEQSEGVLSKLRGDTDTVHAVDDIDLDIYENDVVVLVGESGCGKTTLGKTLIGGQRPTSGSVTYRDQDIWDAHDEKGDVDIPFTDIRRSLQIIHQDPGGSLNPNRTVMKSLAVPLKVTQPDLGREDRISRILALLEYVGMSPPEDYAERYPHQLSGGEQQRVALVRSLLMNPDLIMADEAVSALDVSLRVEMMDLMLRLQELFDTSYVFISHNLSNARYIAGKAGGRIGVMYLGEIVEIGPAEEVIANPKHPYTKVLKWSTADLEADQTVEDPPIRGIDIPDPVDPPSGCRFHTRCPEAREACTQEQPGLDGSDSEHGVACFREYGEDHPYWESEPISGDEDQDSEATVAASDESA